MIQVSRHIADMWVKGNQEKMAHMRAPGFEMDRYEVVEGWSAGGKHVAERFKVYDHKTHSYVLI